jgi:hypothetical protein
MDDLPPSVPLAPEPEPEPEPARAVESATPAVVPRVVAPPKQRVPAITRPKPVLRSRTLWLNGLTVIAAGGMLTGEALDLANRVGIILPEDLTKWALFGVGLVNIVLRFRTTRPLTCGPSVPRSPLEATMRVPGRGPGPDLGGAAAGQP